MSFIPFRVSQSTTPFTFSSSIFIPFSSITTPRKPISLTFHLYFSGFTYKLFSANLFTTSFTISSYSFFLSVSTMTSSMKFAIFPVLIKFQRISFVIVWNVAWEFVSLKNITIGSKVSSGVMNAAFHSSLSFIHTLL